VTDEANHRAHANYMSANPMKTNWGGDKYTQSLIDAGRYSGNEVKIRV
jgi:hypothetical protein